ncbi:MAG TPA: galactose oxidase-like domain-containing protein [Thermoanaerobaculia bacterium]|nr:galactose oxidase-like domain-containing protein [Thermoanaerobaculia bacterium]
MNTSSSRRQRLVLTVRAGLRHGLWALLLCAVMQPALRAQQPPEEPFIEPAEMPHQHKTKVRATVEAVPLQNGRWDTLPFNMPINPVHVALMHTGKVLVIAGSGNEPSNKNLQAAVWDPQSATIKTFKISWDMFCNGMVILPDGRPFVLGGTLKYDKFLGEPRTSAFDPLTETFVDMPPMSGGRWYPTGTVLGDGSVLVYSGLNDKKSVINPTVQIFKGTAWEPAGTTFAGVPLYPREHLLPNGKVFVSGAAIDSQMYDPPTKTFTKSAKTILARPRNYGASVLLPLTVANGFKPKVMILGGVNPTATNTTELIDLSVPSPKWVAGPPMAKGRIQVNATLLPNGKVLISGGSVKDEKAATAVKEAQLYDPVSNKLSSASAMEFPRLYHSNTLLLPDATVVALGGNPQRGSYQPQIEIYSPPYLFKPDGTPATRPAIATAPDSAHYGETFTVGTPDAADIKTVVLIRPGAVTHSFDMDQRLVEAAFTASAGTLTVTAPANGNLAPPGYYLLFLLNSQGVPSVARFIRLASP